MRRLQFSLRLLTVVVTFPLILAYIAAVTLLHPIMSARTRFHTPLRLWMNITDWVKGIPVGYSYWEQYQAPVMLDEIVVHHDD